MCNSVFFNIFTELCNHQYCFRTFSSPQKETLLAILCSHPAQVSGNTYALCLKWMCLFWTFYLRNHKICGPSCLASFTEHVFTVHPDCSLCQSLIPSHGQIIFHYMDASFVYPFQLGDMSYLFSVAIMNNTSMNIPGQGFVWHKFSVLLYISRSGITGSCF